LRADALQVGSGEALGRRLLATTALLLVLGVLASVLVSWAFEMVRALMDDGSGRETLPLVGETHGFFQDPDRPGYYEFDHVRIERGRTMWTRHRMGSNPRDERLPKALEVPHWFESPPIGRGIGRAAYAYGVPYRCLRWEEITYGKMWPVDPNAAKYSIHWKTRWFEARFPLRPMLPGLIANTAFFAGLFGLPLLLFAGRKRRRVQRGHCPFCNYDLRGDFSRACSECGRTSAASES
jgi:hypothetical protein